MRTKRPRSKKRKSSDEGVAASSLLHLSSHTSDEKDETKSTATSLQTSNSQNKELSDKLTEDSTTPVPSNTNSPIGKVLQTKPNDPESDPESGSEDESGSESEAEFEELEAQVVSFNQHSPEKGQISEDDPEDLQQAADMEDKNETEEENDSESISDTDDEEESVFEPNERAASKYQPFTVVDKVHEILLDYTQNDTSDNESHDHATQDTTPSKPDEIEYKSTFSQNSRIHLRAAVHFFRQAKKDPKTLGEVVKRIPLNKMVDENDRQELRYFSEQNEIPYPTEDNPNGTMWNFGIVYIPSVRNSRYKTQISQLILSTFEKKKEEQHCKKILNDESSQALNIMFIDNEKEQDDTEQDDTDNKYENIISTIVFTIVEDEDEPFLCIFYRCTINSSLHLLENSSSMYDKYTINMKGLGCGHLLMRIAQQLLCEFVLDNKEEGKRESYKICLFATDKLIREHYNKLGFLPLGHITKSKDNNLYASASEGMKRCFELEGVYNTNLKLLVRDSPLERDIICFRRVLDRNPCPKIHHIHHNTMETEVRQTVKVFHKELNDFTHHPPTKEENALFISKYVKSGRPVHNPFRHVLPNINHHAMQWFMHTNEFYANEHIVFFSDQSDSEKERWIAERSPDNPNLIGSNVFPMNYVDKLFLREFALSASFSGKRNIRDVTQCEKGNIWCKMCREFILTFDQKLSYLQEYGAEMIHCHITRNYDTLGFTSVTKMDHFLTKQKHVNIGHVRLCEKTDVLSGRQLFQCLCLDKTNTVEERSTRANNAILFVRSALSVYYGNEHLFYKHYISRAIKLHEYILDNIRLDILNRMGKKTLTIDKREKEQVKNYLHAVYKSYFYYQKIEKYHRHSQTQLCQDITTNPKKKPETRPLMFKGENLRKYETSRERTEIREFLIEKEVKLNWHTIELVSRPLRQKGKYPPLPECSKKWKKGKHWLGTSELDGKEHKFVVADAWIPDNYDEYAGNVFDKAFYDSHKTFNKPWKLPNRIKRRIQAVYKEHEMGALHEIRLKIKEDGTKQWDGKTGVPGATYQDVIDEDGLKENFEKYYKPFLNKVLTIPDVWHMVPVGGKSEKHSEAKVEDKRMIPIFIGEEHKCAFANMANGLYELYDYKAARFFEENMTIDHTTLEHLLPNSRCKYVMNEFVMAARLLESVFGYTMLPLKIDDKLLKPVPFGSMKYVTLRATIDGFKHVIAIVGNKILDSSSRHILPLCKENIAWCSSKVVEEIDACSRVIESGYLLRSPLRVRHVFQRRKKKAEEEVNEPQDTNIIFRRDRNTDKKSVRAKRGCEESQEENKKKKN